MVYLNTFPEEGERVYDALQGSGCPDFTLVAVSGLNWDHDMAPWDIAPIAEDDTPCAGGFPKELTSIGIVMSHRAEMIASMLAALKCGAGCSES